VTTLPSSPSEPPTYSSATWEFEGRPALSAVPDLPSVLPAGASDGSWSSREDNSAYPDTAYASRPAVRPGHTLRTVRVTRAAAAVEMLVGAWLAVSPWVVGSGGSRVLRWNDVVVGAALALLAGSRLVRPSLPRTPSVSFGLGAWTIVAAFVLSFQNGATGTAPLWNAIACGAALTGAAAWSTTETKHDALRRD
jgi:hypothetical protein